MDAVVMSGLVGAGGAVLGSVVTGIAAFTATAYQRRQAERAARQHRQRERIESLYRSCNRLLDLVEDLTFAFETDEKVDVSGGLERGSAHREEIRFLIRLYFKDRLGERLDQVLHAYGLWTHAVALATSVLEDPAYPHSQSERDELIENIENTRAGFRTTASAMKAKLEELVDP